MIAFGAFPSGPLAWVLAAAFLGAGAFNMFGPASVTAGFVRWGYPAWWNLVTGMLEIVAAGLIVRSMTRTAGLLLGVAICCAAIATIVRYREYAHLPPGALLLGLCALDLMVRVTS